MTALVFLAGGAAWTLCALGTVWFAARFAGSDTALLNFIIWPVAFLGTLCCIAGSTISGPDSILGAIAERGLKARAQEKKR
jgi:hypothetical protein